jgi:hypothetical protein
VHAILVNTIAIKVLFVEYEIVYPNNQPNKLRQNRPNAILRGDFLFLRKTKRPIKAADIAPKNGGIE